MGLHLAFKDEVQDCKILFVICTIALSFKLCKKILWFEITKNVKLKQSFSRFILHMNMCFLCKSFNNQWSLSIYLITMNLPNCHVNSSWKIKIGSIAIDNGRGELWALQVWRITYNDEVEKIPFFLLCEKDIYLCATSFFSFLIL